jgi:GDP-L-fucose synthase
MTSITGRRVVVTGGAGFLGKQVCRLLRRHDPTERFVPRSREFDLRDGHAIARLFDLAQPEIVIHLAAVVGGIGANRRNPGRYFFDNAIMGIQLIEEARKRDVSRFVVVGTICSYPKHAPVPFREDDLWNGYPEETKCSLWIGKKDTARTSSSVPPAVWHERHHVASGEYLRAR